MPNNKLPVDQVRNVRLVLRLNRKEAILLAKASKKRNLDIAKFVRRAIENEIRRGVIDNLPNVI